MISETSSLSKIFKALSDKNRLEILLFIYNHQYSCSQKNKDDRFCCCIKDIAKKLKITLPTISHHIKELVRAELIETQKKGQCCFCAIKTKNIKKVTQFLINITS